MTPPTDTQLKMALAKLAPNKVYCNNERLYWQPDEHGYPIQPTTVLDTELLHLCREVEIDLSESDRRSYFFYLFGTQRLDDGDLWKAVHVSWQQRVQALCEVKGIPLKKD